MLDESGDDSAGGLHDGGPDPLLEKAHVATLFGGLEGDGLDLVLAGVLEKELTEPFDGQLQFDVGDVVISAFAQSDFGNFSWTLNFAVANQGEDVAGDEQIALLVIGHLSLAGGLPEVCLGLGCRSWPGLGQQNAVVGFKGYPGGCVGGEDAAPDFEHAVTSFGGCSKSQDTSLGEKALSELCLNF